LTGVNQQSHGSVFRGRSSLGAPGVVMSTPEGPGVSGSRAGGFAGTNVAIQPPFFSPGFNVLNDRNGMVLFLEFRFHGRSKGAVPHLVFPKTPAESDDVRRPHTLVLRERAVPLLPGHLEHAPDMA
jgi:hypothetical protein